MVPNGSQIRTTLVDLGDAMRILDIPWHLHCSRNWEIMSAMCSPGGKVKFHIRGVLNWDPRLSSKSLLYNQWEKHWSMVPTYTKIMLGTSQYQAMKDHEGMTNTLGWHSSTCFDDHDPTIELLRPFHSNNQFHYKKIWATGLCIKNSLAISTVRISKPQSRNSENRNPKNPKIPTTSKSFALQATHRRTMQAATWVRRPINRSIALPDPLPWLFAWHGSLF